MLTDAAIKRAKPGEKHIKLADQHGLYLHIAPSGSKTWRLKYRFDKREKTLTFGPYPEVGLAAARAHQAAARMHLRAGIDPGEIKKALPPPPKTIPPEETFEAIAREWHTLQLPRWTRVHAFDVINSLKKDVFPAIGSKGMDEIGALDVLTIVKAVEARKSIETAYRIRQRISQVFGYGMATQRATNDPASSIKAAMAPLIKGRQPAITTLNGVREVLRTVEAAPLHVVTRLAFRLIALTALRPGTLRTTPWIELDNLTDGHLWEVPASRMKMKHEFLVPLSKQALETIAVLRTVTGNGPLAFPGARHANRPMSENTLGYALNRAGYDGRHVPHGFRSSFSTILNERYPNDRQVIDLMLSHSSDDKTEAAYNRAAHLARRTELAQIYADLLLEGFPPPSDLLELPRKSPNSKAL